MNRIFRAAAAMLALPALLAGCGFHLRGDVTYAFPTLYIEAPATSFVIELKRALAGAEGLKVVDSAKGAAVVLELTVFPDDKQVLTLTGGGRVREYSLAKRVAFRLHDADNREWLAPGEVNVRRTYSFNESEVLAREAQENRLLQEMQTDAVQQVVRRLQAAKNPG